MTKEIKLRPILVLGAGSWGTAVAIHMANLGHDVILWGRDKAQLNNMREERVNSKYLPGYAFPINLTLTDNIEDVIADVRAVFCMVPSSGALKLLEQIESYYPQNIPFIFGTKGVICSDDGFTFLHDIASNMLPNTSFAMISGPSFAKEVAAGKPTAIVAASASVELLDLVQKIMHGNNLRLYKTFDIGGVVACSIMKNIIAVASGIVDGLELGANTRSALITRGIAEMQRFVSFLGCNQGTLMGLAGMGDLILTCTDDQSRNRQLGLAIGRGKSTKNAKNEITQSIESLQSIASVVDFSGRNNIDMPITNYVYQVLLGKITPDIALESLLTRTPKYEDNSITQS
jgi:glycerol-3-phosphate dehydrogenase (NAD(P)+)